MPICCATRRASYTSSSEQQRPCTDSGIPSRPASRRWFQSCMVRPMTLRPSARSMAATVEESTPPDMATAIVSCVNFSLLASTTHFHLWVVPRRNRPQMRDSFGNQRQREVNVFFGRLLSQAKADAGACPIRPKAHGKQHMRGLNRSRRTRRTRRHRKAPQIKCDYQRFSFDVIEVKVRRIRNARRSAAVHASFLDQRKDAVLQPVSHGSDLLNIATLQTCLRQLRSLAQRDNAWNIFGTGAARPLMTSAIEQRLQASSLFHIQRTYTLRRMHFMSGNRQRVAADTTNIY